ncbi:hypothetical protein [Amycolatopsis sp. RTGN1]|uniref:hypothetical protein n=1 Tax=Amycolatopsis ponsaeliensis TaxID=2992142 RepID=UPI002550C44D|nr:hypothetical protein [Amycolatopsis sp. RTGN1]
MSTPPEEHLPKANFSKASVDRWQVFGGMAGVAALLLSVVLAVKDLVSLSLVASGLMTLVGVALLFHWGRRASGPLAKQFLVPLLVTIVGATTTGYFVGRGVDFAPREGGDSSARSGVPSPEKRTSSAATAPASTPGGVSAVGSSQAGSPDGEPKRHREDRVTLNADRWIDMDAIGTINRGVSDGAKTKDYDLELYYSLTPQNGGVYVLPGVPTYRDCYNASDNSYNFDSDATKKGGSFCMKTSDGRMARVTVDPTGWPKSVVIDFVVWESPGS